MRIPAELELAKKFYSNILASHGIFSEILNLSSEEVKEGNLCGTCNEFVTIQFKQEGIPPVELFVKKVPAAGKLSNIAVRGNLFEKESYFYTKFLPDARSFVDKRDEYKDINFNSMFAFCYFADSEVIILENLLKKGFIFTTLDDREDAFIRAKVVLENIGTFHGVTRAMIKDIGKEAFREKYKLLVDDHLLSLDNGLGQQEYWEMLMEMAIKVLKDNPNPKTEEAVVFLDRYKGTVMEELSNLLTFKDEDLPSLSLGDIWPGNISFLESPKSEDELSNGVILIDMQGTKMASPVLDVSSFIFSSVPDYIQKNNWQFLLLFMYAMMKETSRWLSVEFKISFEDMKSLYTSKALFGLFNGIKSLLVLNYFQTMDQKEMSLNPDVGAFGGWIRENADISKKLSEDIATKIQLYQSYFPKLDQEDENLK